MVNEKDRRSLKTIEEFYLYARRLYERRQNNVVFFKRMAEIFNDLGQFPRFPEDREIPTILGFLSPGNDLLLLEFPVQQVVVAFELVFRIDSKEELGTALAPALSEGCKIFQTEYSAIEVSQRANFIKNYLPLLSPYLALQTHWAENSDFRTQSLWENDLAIFFAKMPHIFQFYNLFHY